MVVTVYLDLYFAVNVLMNLLLLTVTRWILMMPPPGGGYESGKRRDTREGRDTVQGVRKRHAVWIKCKVRMALSAVLGAVSSCVMLLASVMLPASVKQMYEGVAGQWETGGRMLLLIVLEFLLASVMMILAFGKTSMTELVREVLVFWMLSVLAGGFFEALGQSVGSSVRSSLCPAAAFLLCGWLMIRIWRAWIGKQRCIYEVTVRYQGRETTLTALWDTGNQLFEPYSHQPVHVITYSACKRFCSRVTRVIYIPFCSVGAEQGMLPGIQVDEMKVMRKGTLIRCCEKPWLAISRSPLSPHDRYEMLLHGEF